MKARAASVHWVTGAGDRKSERVRVHDSVQAYTSRDNLATANLRTIVTDHKERLFKLASQRRRRL